MNSWEREVISQETKFWWRKCHNYNPEIWQVGRVGKGAGEGGEGRIEGMGVGVKERQSSQKDRFFWDGGGRGAMHVDLMKQTQHTQWLTAQQKEDNMYLPKALVLNDQ